jgi:hypothetical protein
VEKAGSEQEIYPILLSDIDAYSNECGRTGIMDITKIKMIWQVKYGSEHDPFRADDGKNFHRETDDAIDTIGQITTYATAHMPTQLCSHIFPHLFFGRMPGC